MLPSDSETRVIQLSLSRTLRVRRFEGEWQVAIRRAPNNDEVSQRIPKPTKGWSRQQRVQSAVRWGWFVGQDSDLLTAVARAAGCSSFDPDVRQLVYYLETLTYEPKETAAAVA